MTAAEFDAVTPLLPISRDRINAARAALFDDPASHRRPLWLDGAIRQRAVTVVWKTLRAYRVAQSRSANAAVLLPPGWEQVTLIAPTELMSDFAPRSRRTPGESLMSWIRFAATPRAGRRLQSRDKGGGRRQALSITLSPRCCPFALIRCQREGARPRLRLDLALAWFGPAASGVAAGAAGCSACGVAARAAFICTKRLVTDAAR